MTIKELEEFRMICLRGSLARASKELFMSPQGLSRVLKNLENELECTLLDRVASGIELTESGQRLYDYANTVLSEYDKLKKEIDMIRASEEGTVELLVAYDILRYLTPDCILEFQKKYPNVTFSYMEYPDRIVEKMSLDKEGNVALSIGPFAGDCFDMKSLKKCSLGLLVYEGHSLAKKEKQLFWIWKASLFILKTAVLNSMSLFRADAGTGDLNRILYLRQMDLISAIKCAG